MNFGQAIEALKQGYAVSRFGWNGKNMKLVLVPGSEITVTEGRPLAKIAPIGSKVIYQPHIDMFTATGSIVPWLASQSDVLAEDWQIVIE